MDYLHAPEQLLTAPEHLRTALQHFHNRYVVLDICSGALTNCSWAFINYYIALDNCYDTIKWLLRST